MRSVLRRLILGPDPAPARPEADPRLASFEARLGELEETLAALRTDIAATRMAVEATDQRQNIALSLYENRVDQIYRRVIEEFGRGRGEGRLVTETEEAADARLLALVSAGLETTVDLDNLRLRDMVSQTISPGTIEGSLTLYGFKLNRAIARERGRYVHVAPSAGEIAIFGPYRKLAPGAYRAVLHYEAEEPADLARQAGGLTLDIYSPAADEVVAKADIDFAAVTDGAPPPLAVAFDWGARQAEGPIEIRLLQRSTAALRVRAVSLERR